MDEGAEAGEMEGKHDLDLLGAKSELGVRCLIANVQADTSGSSEPPVDFKA